VKYYIGMEIKLQAIYTPNLNVSAYFLLGEKLPLPVDYQTAWNPEPV
jgi:hypothetical protein